MLFSISHDEAKWFVAASPDASKEDARYMTQLIEGGIDFRVHENIVFKETKSSTSAGHCQSVRSSYSSRLTICFPIEVYYSVSRIMDMLLHANCLEAFRCDPPQVTTIFIVNAAGKMSR